MKIISEGSGRLHIDERLSAFDTCRWSSCILNINGSKPFDLVTDMLIFSSKLLHYSRKETETFF